MQGSFLSLVTTHSCQYPLHLLVPCSALQLSDTGWEGAWVCAALRVKIPMPPIRDLSLAGLFLFLRLLFISLAYLYTYFN